jgi:hypothetical protein
MNDEEASASFFIARRPCEGRAPSLLASLLCLDFRLRGNDGFRANSLILLISQICFVPVPI